MASVYTYQFYKNPSVIKLSTNKALATSETQDSGKASGDQKKERIKVKVSQSFKASKVKNFELSAYQSMKIKFSKSDGDQIIVSLIGEGSDYKKEGQNLEDWFELSNKGNSLKIKSYEKNSSKKYSSMKDLAKIFKDTDDSDFTMIIEFPEKHVFEKMKMGVVSSDVFGSQLSFKAFAMSSVSGDLQLKASQGDSIKLEAVSGDGILNITGLKKAEFSSVSGDIQLKALQTNPELKFSSVSGDLTLSLPKDSAIDVEFESMTGDLKNDFGISKKGTSSKSLKFSSLSGDATIRKLK